jgi:predicted transcriptional regulator
LQSHPHRAASDVRHDIVKAGAIISEVHRDVVNTQAMVRTMLKSQQEAGGQDQSVSDTCVLFATVQNLSTT